MRYHPVHRHGAAAWLLALLLAGCSLGPNYEPPQLEIPTSYRASSAPEPVWPSTTWWQGFGSPELDGLIDEAERNSFDIQAAIARVQQADAQLRIAGSPLLPTVTVSGSANWADQSQRNRFGVGGIKYSQTRLYNLVPSASYELDLWGKLRAGKEAAAATALFSRYDQQNVALTTISAIATTWFQALAFQDRVDIARRNLADAEQVLQAIRGRQEVGTASLLDVSQQEALAQGIRASIPGLQSQLEQTLNGLGVLVGRPPEAITARPGTLNTLATPEPVPGLPSLLLARRPDVAGAEAELISANANIKVARADFFPAVTLTGSAGWQSLALGTLFGPGSFFATAAATAVQSVFANGAKQGALEQARGRYDELLADYRKTVVQAFTDVEDAVTAYRLASEQEVLQRAAVVTAQRAADIASAQVAAGTSDIVTALQAQTTLFTDLDTLVQVRLARFLALVNLYKALGGGWTREDVSPPRQTIYQGVL